LYDPEAKRCDATGAGDAFASGFVAKYAAGESLKNAVHFASANSASVVQFIGSKPGILTGREKLAEMKLSAKPANY
jgi:sugar/nucleoside kinase (ribokinase family)